MKYYKYDASGNTFVIFHSETREDFSNLAKELCAKERYDADGLIAIIPHEILDFEWLFYNNDGSSAAMCGNGTRAVAMFAYEHGYAHEQMRFLTGAGEISCKINENIVETQMTQPFQIKEPFIENNYNCWIVDTGVPHLVILTDDLDKFDVEVCREFRHKYNANVNFVYVDEKQDLYVRTYERGVEDETLACGTGMVASFLRALELGLVDCVCKVYPKSKEQLQIRIEKDTIYFSGEVQFVTSGD